MNARPGVAATAAPNPAYRLTLLAIFCVALVIGCINPTSWKDMAYQHIPTLVFVGGFVWSGRRHPLSNTSYTLLLIYLLAHILGAHYLYSNVPYDRWSTALFGRSISEVFGFERNHYDRLIHFACGICLTPVAAEICVRFGGARRGWWAAFIAISVVGLLASLYEVAEWLISVLASPEDAENYNGQQGDVFDPQKDMALSFVGSLITGAWIALRPPKYPHT